MLTPTDDVTAGSYGAWTVTYTVGELGMDDGSTLKVAWSQTSDWETPQFTDPTAARLRDGRDVWRRDGVRCVRLERLRATVETNGDDRVFNGPLDPGDTVTHTLGNADTGSLGHRARSFVESNFELFVLVDPVRTREFLRLPEPLSLDFVPGRARRMEAVTPSTVAPDDP